MNLKSYFNQNVLFGKTLVEMPGMCVGMKIKISALDTVNHKCRGIVIDYPNNYNFDADPGPDVVGMEIELPTQDVELTPNYGYDTQELFVPVVPKVDPDNVEESYPLVHIIHDNNAIRFNGCLKQMLELDKEYRTFNVLCDDNKHLYLMPDLMGEGAFSFDENGVCNDADLYVYLGNTFGMYKGAYETLVLKVEMRPSFSEEHGNCPHYRVSNCALNYRNRVLGETSKYDTLSASQVFSRYLQDIHSNVVWGVMQKIAAKGAEIVDEAKFKQRKSRPNKEIPADLVEQDLHERLHKMMTGDGHKFQYTENIPKVAPRRNRNRNFR